MKKDLSLLALSAFATLPLAHAQTQPARLPNVIYMMADDLGIGDLGCYGQQKIKTPHIDNLAANGIRFTNHYSGAPVSAPSRCSVLTGKHIGHACIRGNQAVTINGERYDHPLAAQEVTLGEIFRQKEYTTACIGKWGLGGPGTEGHPNRQGFDYFYGYLGQGTAHSYYPQYLHENEDKVLLNGNYYTHDLIVEKTLDFIDNNADKPFFIYFTPTIPHADLVVPEGELGDYDGRFQETPYTGGSYTAQPKPRATFAAMVTRLDNDVKRIMDLLEEKGIAHNTIVIFTSDNGAHNEGGADPGFFQSAGGLRGIKRDLYEGGVRCPYIVHWPAVIKEARDEAHRAAFWDLMPTMCELIGVPVPEDTDGISFLPIITGEGDQSEHEYMYWEFHEGGGKRSVLKGDWKLIQLSVNNLGGRQYELYNLATDPYEKSNEASTNTAKVEELKLLLESSRTKSGIWDFAESIEIEGMDVVAITSADASSHQGPNTHISKSYDRDFSTNYHSNWTNSTPDYFPITLNYYFDPATISAIVYHTRTDNNSNGNFKEFELWALPREAATDGFVRIGNYNFEGEAGAHRLDFDGETTSGMQDVKALRFVVKSGSSNFASCSEMLFYTKAKAPLEEVIAGREKLNITHGAATSFEPGRGIEKSFDNDPSTNYHSAFKSSATPTTFPVLMDYFFNPADLKVVVYYTRTSDGTNGNFKEFKLHVLPVDGDGYVEIGTYNFNGTLGVHWLDLSEVDKLKTGNVRGVRFEVLSGMANLVSCSEMAFYGERGAVDIDRDVVADDDPCAPSDVYSLQGVKQNSGARLEPGMYIVRRGNKSTKIGVGR